MTDRKLLSEQMEHGYPPNLYDQKLEIKMNGDAYADTVTVNGEQLRLLRDIQVSSDMQFTEVTLTFLAIPSTGEIVVSGYLVGDEDMKILKKARQEGMRP